MAVTYKQCQAYRWYRAHYDELVTKYGKGFIVIDNDKVVGKFDSHLQAMSFACRCNDPATCIVMELTAPGELNVHHTAYTEGKYKYNREE